LRWFQLVADGATVTEVAELHMVSQPGVSRALARLDREVGTALFQRHGRTLHLTHAGSVFKRHIDTTLHRLDDGLAAVSELLSPETGTVSLSFQLSLGTWLVPQLISGFAQEHPQVRFRLEHSLDSLGSSQVASGNVDLEFTSRRPHNPSVTWERLFSQPLCLAVPADHRLARRSRIPLAEAAGEGFVMLRRSWDLRSRSEEMCLAAGFSPTIAYEGDDLPVVLGFVAAGLGVSIVPERDSVHAKTTRTGSRGERLVPLEDQGAFRDIGLAWSKERRLLPSAEQFRQHVITTVRQERRDDIADATRAASDPVG
jgi:DNA-binding transcriptional LysR family regulator